MGGKGLCLDGLQGDDTEASGGNAERVLPIVRHPCYLGLQDKSGN